MIFSETVTVSSTTGTGIYRRHVDVDRAEKVLLLHGLGDHIGCHDWAAKLLLQSGFSPEGFDWPGHGQSTGRRGDIPGVDAAIQLIDEMINQMKSPPVGVFAHSTGGFVLLHYLDEKICRGETIPFRWIWLNSPLLRPGHNQSALKKYGAKWLGQYLPRLTFPTGVTRKHCCHMENANKGDPRTDFEGCHNRVSLRYGNSLLDYESKGFSTGIPIPDSLRLLFSQGNEDPICPPHLAMNFFQQIPAIDKTFILIKGARHEAFREEDPQSFHNSAAAWLSGC